MFQIQTCTCYVSLFEIKRIQAVVAVHKGLKDWDSLRVNGHLADQKFESRGKLSAKDQSAGVEKIISLQKGTFRRKFRNLQISVKVLAEEPRSDLACYCRTDVHGIVSAAAR